MKQPSRNRQPASTNRRYSIPTVQTEIGQDHLVVWSNEITNVFHHGRHTVEIRLHKSETLWTSDTYPEVKELLKDRARNGGTV